VNRASVRLVVDGMTLAGDIGGTNARLGLFHPNSSTMRLAKSATYPSREHASLEDIVRRFVAEHPASIERACLAVAGPVTDHRVVATNLARVVDTERLAGVLGLRTVALGGRLDYFLTTVFNYPTLAECYKVAALNAANKLAAR
jgi:glucokinase